MKSIYAIALAACTLSFAACKNNQTDTTSTTTAESTAVAPAPETATDATATTTTTTTSTHTPAEGDVTYEGGRVRVYRGNAWADANDDVHLDNGVVIHRNGQATRNGVDVYWDEGYVVDRNGNVWDRAGNAISDAWDATKHGVKKAGKAVGNAANKVEEKAKDVVR